MSKITKKRQLYSPSLIEHHNLLPITPGGWKQGTIGDADSTTRLIVQDFIAVLPDTDYYVSIEGSGYSFINIELYNQLKQRVDYYYNVGSAAINGTTGMVVHFPDYTYFIKCIVRCNPDGTEITPSEIPTIKPQMVLGKVRLPYTDNITTVGKIYQSQIIGRDFIEN